MPEFYPHRSALYMPGSNERALEKAKSLSADLFIFDMEDAVSPDNKERARDLISNVLSNEKADYRGKKILTRINSHKKKASSLLAFFTPIKSLQIV